MDLHLSFSDKFKLSAKTIGHKVVQYRLSTGRSKQLDTKCGKVKGMERKTYYDGESYYSFEGIPYAQPPLGELRFRAPQPAKNWEGVRDCTYARSQPMQKNSIMNIVEGSENCLYLNVYVKQLETPRKLPVMVWIYGGGFQFGGATRDIYAPDYFMKHDVLLVTFNYRVGALGFLSLKDRDLQVPGNAGLKDQVLALRWVHDNIASFNGDVDNITLMGESAGAASSHIMMLTEQTRGLFHRVILQSGSALCEWGTHTDRNWVQRLAKRMGYKADEADEKQLLQFLRNAPATQLAHCGSAIVTQEEQRNYQIIAFGPVIEPYVGEDCVIPRPHLEQLASAWSNELPLIIGGTSFEGLFSYQSTLHDREHMLSAFEAIIPPSVRDAIDADELAEQLRRLKLAYFDDADRAKMELFECLRLLSVKHFWHGIHRSLLARLAYAPATPTYLYRFDMDSPHFNHFRILNCGRNVRGVCHADDVSYMFYTLLSSKLDRASLEYRTIERLIGMWTSFATTGDPNCKQIEPTKWEPLRPGGSELCLNIGEELEFKPLPESKEFVLWDSFYTRETLY
ncbi:esterase B1 [Drosophila grimshawi]|uniref:carboxylesterase n=1 Tax=Drosophila grimshawi TaxID=7222 RepID=B4J9C9_DROGR|nr:esterase B1 [Drosophila grimshawi]EDW01410.1 GH20471 [Drosophila grimshawi]